MAVQMPCAGFVFTRRLMRICSSSPRLLGHRDVPVELRKGRSEVRPFSAGSGRCCKDEREDSDSSCLGTKLTSRPALVARRRPLSPLERLSALLPPDALSPEVTELREQRQEQDDEGDADVPVSVTHRTQEQRTAPETLAEDEATSTEDDSHGAPGAAVEPNVPERSATLPGESTLAFGEFLVAEYYKKSNLEFRRMFKLQKENRLNSNVGVILHDDVVGQPAGQIMKTNLGVPILIKRASLEDYVLYMRRGPAIAYPKDAVTMLMMMDVMPGDCVLESGSGSGAMSLFLSRAVGSEGSVLSVEVREDHFKRAKRNYKAWRSSWSVRRGEEWPDNVQFHNADLGAASSLLSGRGFHAIALDMMNPQLVLPAVIPHLHPGAVCAVYLANITQVIDLLEGVRCSALPLLCECIVEVPIRHWLVVPALQKDGKYCARKAPNVDEEEEAETDRQESTADKPPAFGSFPYIARPHNEQNGHTAFLVKLRKRVQ